ncbi:MAG: PAS domain-containing protein, partial [Deltaproteobacteria bacterium]|nr:PAS domain-containing protein [Deltaproteobacteria bacterium]
MKLSRRLNIVILQLIVIVAIVTVFILVPIQKSRVDAVNKKLIALMQVFISQDNTVIANAIFENRSRAIDIRLMKIIQLDDVTNAVVFNGAFHLLSTSAPSLPIENFSSQFEIAIEQHFSSWTTTDTLWYLQSIDLFDETIGFVLIEYSLTDMNRREYMNIVVLTLILFAIMSIFLLVLNRMIKNRVLLPVNSLIENMTSIEDGHYGGQIDIRSDDEIGDLAYKYNAMSRQIMQTYNRVLSIGNMLETIIDSMPSVLFSINGDTVVVAWNAAAEKFTDLSRKEAIGRCYADLFPLLV